MRFSFNLTLALITALTLSLLYPSAGYAAGDLSPAPPPGKGTAAKRKFILKVSANQERVSVRAEKAQFRMVLLSISKQAGVGFRGDAPKEFMDKDISITFSNFPLEPAIRAIANEVGIKHISFVYTRLKFHGVETYLMDKANLYFNEVGELTNPKQAKPGRIKPLSVALYPISAYLPAVLREKFLPADQALKNKPFGAVYGKKRAGKTPPPEVLKKREEYKKRMMEESKRKRELKK